MIEDFVDAFVSFVTYAVPYVIIWNFGGLIVNKLIDAICGRRFEI